MVDSSFISILSSLVDIQVDRKFWPRYARNSRLLVTYIIIIIVNKICINRPMTSPTPSCYVFTTHWRKSKNKAKKNRETKNWFETKRIEKKNKYNWNRSKFLIHLMFNLCLSSLLVQKEYTLYLQSSFRIIAILFYFWTPLSIRDCISIPSWIQNCSADFLNVEYLWT